MCTFQELLLCCNNEYTPELIFNKLNIKKMIYNYEYRVYKVIIKPV